MRRSTAIVLCCACAATLLALAPAHASAAYKRTARPSRHAAALHARRARDRVVVLAWRAVGTPYRWGGSSPRGGFECSGLTRWVYGHVGISLPHYSVAQRRYGRRMARRALRPGDPLFFLATSASTSATGP